MRLAPALLLAAAACALCGCNPARTDVRRLQPGVYEIVRIDCGFPTDTGMAEQLRAEIERTAAARCTHGYQLDQPELSRGDMRGSAVTGECPTAEMRAIAHCRPGRVFTDSLSPSPL